MPFYEKGDVRIYYEETGQGYPLLALPGGGLNGSTAFWTTASPFNAMEEFKDEYRCVTLDMRNSYVGKSSGPVQTSNAWQGYCEDFFGLMDHLGIGEFHVMGFCIGGPYIMKMLEMAPQRITAAVLAQPSGFLPDMPDLFWDSNTSETGWGPRLCAKRPELSMETVKAHLHDLYRTNPDFVFSVTREFARTCQTPALVLPDGIPAHPFQTSMDLFKLLPNAEVSMYPWQDPKELIPGAVERVRSFLKAHTPVTTSA